MKILLTGAAGFIGSAVHDVLASAGREVVTVDALIPQAWAGSATPAVEHRVDVRDQPALVELLAGVDVVCHQAAMVGAGVTPSDLPSYAGNNDLGTATLLAAMHESGVGRLVLASSMVVYGDGAYSCVEHGPERPSGRSVVELENGRFDQRCSICGEVLAWDLVGEDAPLEPRSAYAASKVAQEHFVSAWVRQAGTRAVALRYHNVYGPRMPRDTPYSGVAALFRSALERGEAPRVFEDGRQMRDFVHVSDVARATVLALEAVAATDTTSYSAFNVCSGVPVSIGEVARLLGPGVSPKVTGEFRPGDVRHVVASAQRAREVLGFDALVPPQEGLPRFATDPLR